MEKPQNNTPCFFTQQVFLIGTYNEDGSDNFAPISWISYTNGEPSCLIISIKGIKNTPLNIERTGLLSAAIVTPEWLPLIEQFNDATYSRALFENMHYDVVKGNVLNVPLLADSKFSYECEVIQTVKLGETATYFAQIKNINMSEEIKALEFFDLRVINPLIYSPMNYFTVGEHLGRIGDFSKA